MHVVAKEPSRPAMQPPRTPGKAVRVNLGFCHVVLWTDRNRTERPRMGVRCTLVIHGHIEETCGAQGFARWFDLFQMAADGFFTFVKAEHCLECRRLSAFVRHVMDERIV